VSTGHGDVPWEACFRMLNTIGYDGPISIEWEDAGMDRLVGAPEALEFVRRLAFAPPGRLLRRGVQQLTRRRARAQVPQRASRGRGRSRQIAVRLGRCRGHAGRARPRRPPTRGAPAPRRTPRRPAVQERIPHGDQRGGSPPTTSAAAAAGHAGVRGTTVTR
jgi:hypothetical protein